MSSSKGATSKWAPITKGRIEWWARLHNDNFSLGWGNKCSTIDDKKEKNKD